MGGVGKGCSTLAREVANGAVGVALAIEAAGTAGRARGENTVEMVVSKGLGLGRTGFVVLDGEDVAEFVIGIAKVLQGGEVAGHASRDFLQTTQAVEGGVREVGVVGLEEVVAEEALGHSSSGVVGGVLDVGRGGQVLGDALDHTGDAVAVIHLLAALPAAAAGILHPQGAA